MSLTFDVYFENLNLHNTQVGITYFLENKFAVHGIT